jgi:chromosome segregation ATPase
MAGSVAALYPLFGGPAAMKESKQMQVQDQQVKAGIQKALELASRCSASETSDNYEFLEEQVDQIEAQAREVVQSKLELDSLLEKLNGREPLTPSDLRTLELLIVGDAEFYLKYESELTEWKTQLKRVLDEVASLQNSVLDIDGLMHLRALCREAHESLADLVFYFDAKERAVKFKASTQGPIDAEGYTFLAKIVREMLTSDKM